MIREADRRRWFSVLVSLVALVTAVAAWRFFISSHPGDRVDNHLDFLVPLILSIGFLFAIPFTTTKASYYAVQIATVVAFLLTATAAAEYPGVQIMLLVIFLGELILYEPYPLNIAETTGVTLVLMTASAARLASLGLSTELVLRLQAITVLPGVVISVFGSLMTKYREIVVTLGQEQNRLRSSIVELTRTNSAYQDYAVVAQEHATEKERQRITRDIHDIVGYTLTNNLMLMEAAMDLMQENALALPSIIETARENAQEGLNEVRAAMYKLREQENTYPIGLNAIVRLGRVFEQATGAKVTYEFSNMPLTITDQIDSAIYHLIQEALVNSFRHGAATEVTVSFWYGPGSVQVRIQDNGEGADAIVEGIGLQGMRERLGKVGGTLTASSETHGFTVDALVRWSGEE